MRKGERVGRDVTEGINKCGTTWAQVVEIYYIHGHYNVEVQIQETDTGFLAVGDRYECDAIGIDTKDELEDTIKELTRELFEAAASRSEARALDISVHIE
jgi:hypothetical protein